MPAISTDTVTVHLGNCLDVLRILPDASIDSIVTDPPYGLSNTDPAHVVEALTKWATGDREFTPTGRGFMGKSWDAFVPPPAVWDECFRVLKPGGHLLAFAGSRTFDLMTLSIRFSGFDIRDSIAWLYGSGFPKSLDVSKAIDKANGRVGDAMLALKGKLREAFDDSGLKRGEIDSRCGFRASKYLTLPAEGKRPDPWVNVLPTSEKWATMREVLGCGPALDGLFDAAEREIVEERRSSVRRGDGTVVGLGHSGVADITAPATPAAQQWSGWGTALKPAFEPIVVARKPLIGTVAANVLAHGTGALNIDGCRVGEEVRVNPLGTPGANNYRLHGGDGRDADNARAYDAVNRGEVREPVTGRWPANVVLDGDTADALDEQTADLKGGVTVRRNLAGQEQNANGIYGSRTRDASEDFTYGDSGGASRFFPTFRYQAKAPTRERPTYFRPSCDCENAWPTPTTSLPRATDETTAPASSNTSKSGSGSTVAPWSQTDVCGVCGAAPKREAHATVKPLALMRWLVKLVTPPGGVVLDPFVGSGTTVEAAALEGFQAVGIEGEVDYLPLIQQRIDRLPETAVE